VIYLAHTHMHELTHEFGKQLFAQRRLPCYRYQSYRLQK